MDCIFIFNGLKFGKVYPKVSLKNKSLEFNVLLFIKGDPWPKLLKKKIPEFFEFGILHTWAVEEFCYVTICLTKKFGVRPPTLNQS